MAERPIIFSGEMVRAILDGRKTQTRRVLKMPKCGSGMHMNPNIGALLNSMTGERIKLPYAPGDTLWVRETWCGHLGPASAARRAAVINHTYGGDAVLCFYRADGDLLPFDHSRWDSPIFMPRWASRITLRVTDVRVERLQEISEEDAAAEGAMRRLIVTADETIEFAATLDFARLWNSINAKRPGCSWDDNPWVVAIGFEVID